MARIGRVALLALAVLLGLLGLPAPAAAAPAMAAAASAPARGDEAPPALLRVMNRDILLMRAPLLGAPPAERVQRARERIAQQMASGGPLQVSTRPLVDGHAVLLDGRFSFAVLDADADPLAPPEAPPLLEQAVAALELAVAERRESRDLRQMAAAAGRAAMASAVALVLALGLLRLRRWAEVRALAWADLRSAQLPLQGAAELLRERLTQAVPALVRGLALALVLLIAYQWLSLVFGQFPYTRRLGEQLNGALWGVASGLVLDALGAVPDLLTALLMFLIARYATRGCRAFFERVRTGHIRLSWLEPELAGTTWRIANALIWVFALVMAYPYLPGSQTEAFKGVSVLVGLMISLGASNLVGQAASGLILTYGRVIRQGEYLRVAEHEGTVTEGGLFTTRLRTGMGEELTLPNSFILANVTRNYSRTVQGPGFILVTSVTIGYDTPWRQVHALLLEAARRTEGVLTDPAPRVYQVALSDFYPEYRLVCQAIPAGPRPRAEVMHALHAHIQDTFAEAGVQIMSPHYLADPAEAKVPPVVAAAARERGQRVDAA